MMEKAYSLFLCTLLISVVFLPSTAAERALLQTAETEGVGGKNGRNDGNKMGVTGSRSKPAPSKTGSSSPSKPTPVSGSRKPAVSCGGGRRYHTCLAARNRPKAPCNPFVRNCR